MIVAAVAVRMVQMAINEIIDMLAMWHFFALTSRTCSSTSVEPVEPTGFTCGVTSDNTFDGESMN